MLPFLLLSFLQYNMVSSMKSSALVLTAILAACGSTAPVKSNSSPDSHIQSKNTTSLDFRIDQIPTNITAYHVALDSCVEELSKASHDTRSKLGIDAKHNERFACRKIFSHMYPELRHSFGHRPKTNATEIHNGKEHHLSLAKKQELFVKEELNCLTEIQSKGDISSKHMGRERSKCMAKASQVVEALDRDPAKVEDQILENQKRGLQSKHTSSFGSEPFLQELRKEFRSKIADCNNELAHNSTRGREDFKGAFQSCIERATLFYARELQGVEEDDVTDKLFKLEPNLRDEDQLLHRHELKEIASVLREDLELCRHELLSNTTVLTEHGLDYSTDSFQNCVQNAATKYSNALANVGHALYFGLSPQSQSGEDQLETSNSSSPSLKTRGLDTPSPGVDEMQRLQKINNDFRAALKECDSQLNSNGTVAQKVRKETFSICVKHAGSDYSYHIRNVYPDAEREYLNHFPLTAPRPTPQERAYQAFNQKLSDCHTRIYGRATKFSIATLSHSLHDFESCAHTTAIQFIKRAKEISKSWWSHDDASVITESPNNSTSLAKRDDGRKWLPRLKNESKWYKAFIKDLNEVAQCIGAPNSISACSSAMMNNAIDNYVSPGKPIPRLIYQPSWPQLLNELDGCRYNLQFGLDKDGYVACVKQATDSFAQRAEDVGIAKRSLDHAHLSKRSDGKEAPFFPVVNETHAVSKRTSHVWETLQVPKGRNLLDELKRHDSAAAFFSGVRKCNFEQSINATARTFDTCIRDTTDEFSHNLISVEQAKFHWMIELPDIFDEDSLLPWKVGRENAYEHLQIDFENCSGHLKNSTIPTTHGLSNFATRTFEICVRDAVQVFQKLVDVVDDMYGPDSFPYENINGQASNSTSIVGTNNSTIQARAVEVAPKNDTIPGAAFKQTDFHTKELYSMASLAHSYSLNICYDLAPYIATYTNVAYSEDFRACKAEKDQKYKALKNEITAFLKSKVIYDVNHGAQVRDAVTQLRSRHYSCGGDADCFYGAVEEFMRALKGLGEPVETWRGLIPSI